MVAGGPQRRCPAFSPQRPLFRPRYDPRRQWRALRGAPIAGGSFQVVIMRKTITHPTLALLAFLGFAVLLSACHTTAGAGKDISKTGQAITRSANEATPR